MPPQDPQRLAQHTKNDTKARRIILEGVRDHIIPHLNEKTTMYEMFKFKVIFNLFQASTDVTKLALKEKLRSKQMSKDEPIITYLSKFTQVQDELGGVGILPHDHEQEVFQLPEQEGHAISD